MKCNPSAILFDMDGVLVDSFNIWWKSLNIALKHFNYKEVTKEEFTNIYWGHGLRDNIKRMGFSKEVGNYCNMVYNQHVDEIIIFEDTINTLKKLMKYKKAIITNTPRNSAKKIIEKFNIGIYFSTIITSDDVVNEKPDPEIIYKACKKLGVSPEEVILIGDTKNDIIAGKAAGCKVIGVKIQGDYTVNSLSNLLEIIE
jgi:HAD superfamily hydrolase (TIGR01509 family)